MTRTRTNVDYDKVWKAAVEQMYKNLEKADSPKQRSKIKHNITRYERKLRALNNNLQVSYKDWQIELIKLIIEEKHFTKQYLRVLAIKTVVNDFYAQAYRYGKTPAATWRKELSGLKGDI